MSPQSRVRRAPVPLTVNALIGAHPSATSHALGDYFDHLDEVTSTQVPHRALVEIASNRGKAVAFMKQALVRHHASREQLQRTQQIRDVMQRQGLSVPASLSRFPRTDTTRKGNFAEVVLAEYVTATSSLQLPVYRLRHNPNVDQSMKGDDVLAFDLDSDPMRILVGEAKFRKTPSAAAVSEIVDGLLRSFHNAVPVSLQFVADSLYAAQRPDLGKRVAECALRIGEGRLRVDYVGLLFSNGRAAEYVRNSSLQSFRNLLILSANVSDPSQLVEDSFQGLV